jgi:dipeptidyl aminopeptidase/acylaminoacyl peptidase
MCGLVFVLLLLPATLLLSQVTIENLLGTAFPSDLTVTRDGKRLAWIFNDHGMRNVWVAQAPAFNARKITEYNSDDGQELSFVTFTPAGDRVVFVRGGSSNSKGEYPNPIVLQEEVENSIWVVSMDGSALHKVGQGSSPKISPDGKRVAFLSGGQVWLGYLDSVNNAKKLFQSRGSQESVRWSPDGTKLAFVSDRGDHSFVGVYDLASSSVQFLNVSVDHDSNPVWSPNGDNIAFIRTPNSRNRLPFALAREGYPWSIRIVDVVTGKARELWHASPGRGSVLYDELPVVDNLLWWSHERLVFPWEKDGWQHLYSISSAGGDPLLLTPGEGEVENVALTADGNSLLYVSNINDIHRRHIWKVAITGGQSEQLSKRDGIEWNPVETSEGIVCLRSEATRPAWPHILGSDGKSSTLFTEQFPKTFPSSALVVPQAVTITATDGMNIQGQLFLPKNHKSGEKFPAVIFFHGGSQRQMILGFHYRQYYHNAYALNQYLANQGYIVLSVNYRSGIGYGLEFREALDYGAAGASEYRDVEGAGLYLRQRDDVDGKRIGLWGGSYGGYLTALGLARASDLFSCGVDIHGVHDWNVAIHNFVPSYQSEKREEFARKAYQSSPMYYVKTWRSPVLLIHGDDDRNVPFSETVNLVENLREQGIHYEQLIFPDEVHSFLLHKSWVKAYTAAADFFGRQFKTQK